ncbi:SidA/IucD/PvdA family monooxygenase [Frankia sp. Mgl5]|uniref:SidA/IucD/PvdA family monooxygenase n=1 Tax=Frankia sp. Mgl5 TaxID=2933793 RepID=UPI0034D47201
MRKVNIRSDEVGMPPDVVDIVGIGFGSANLSLAIAIEERNSARPPADRVTIRFVEVQPRFGWHDGMLLSGATMQISFLKDLATMRSPTSSYSFLNYLHERGRLSDFINLKSFFPTRLEFRNYLAWAAARVDVPVSYGARAARVDHDGAAFTVTVSGGREEVRARVVVVATGLSPVLPDGIEAGPRVFHNHGLLGSLDRLPSTPHGRFLVAGAGQSAAEVAAYLHDTYPTAEVHASIRSFGYVRRQLPVCEPYLRPRFRRGVLHRPARRQTEPAAPALVDELCGRRRRAHRRSVPTGVRREATRPAAAVRAPRHRDREPVRGPGGRQRHVARPRGPCASARFSRPAVGAHRSHLATGS